jgi:hypothetical protein
MALRDGGWEMLLETLLVEWDALGGLERRDVEQLRRVNRRWKQSLTVRMHVLELRLRALEEYYSARKRWLAAPEL